MAATFRVDAGKKSAVLGATEFVIGRSLYCTLVVDDPSVSRIHASLRKVEDACEVRDLGSTNGTFVNGQRLGSGAVRVTPADQIRLGHLAVRLVPMEHQAGDRVRTLQEPPAVDVPTEVSQRVRSSKQGDSGG